VSPSVTTSYTVSGTNTLGCISNAILTVSINPLPTITAVNSDTFICIGESTTLTASGASTYNWSAPASGSMAVVSPTTTTVYTITGISAAGCVNTATIVVDVYPELLTLTANTTICTGGTAELNAGGSGNYSWSTGSPFSSISVSPSTFSVYTVTGTDVNGCVATKSVSVTVSPNPTVTASTSKTVVCKDELVVLTATGAVNYSWTTGSTAPTATVIPLINIIYTYTVTGTNADGCVDKDVIQLRADLCTGIESQDGTGTAATVFPNPSHGLFTVSMSTRPSQSTMIGVYNVSGELIKSFKPVSDHAVIDLQEAAAGVYFVRITEAGKPVYMTRIVKQ
jgi:hypothetical protein